MKNTETKRILLPFSSGLDSTYLLYKNLKEGNKVDTIYIEIENNLHKSRIEKIHRVKLINILSQSNLINKDLGTVFKTSVSSFNHNLSLNQPLIWLTGLQYCNLSEYDEVEFGYIIGDCAISFIPEITNIYNSMNKLQDYYFSNKKSAKLKFPIIKYYKFQIFEQLLNYSDELVKYIWSCENPNILEDTEEFYKYAPCEECASCKRKKDDLGYNYKYHQYSYNKKLDYLSILPYTVSGIDSEPHSDYFKKAYCPSDTEAEQVNIDVQE